MRIIKIVGAGQLGSRHLQALQAIEEPLEIHVVDPSPVSLTTALERFNAIRSDGPHRVFFSQEFEKTSETSIAIVATNANVRRKAVEELLSTSSIKYLILEKLLFVDRADYTVVGEKVATAGIKAWVNCPMRIMPVYEKIRSELVGKQVLYRVTGSQFGLVTNAIHYIDHVAHLTGCDRYVLDTSRLDKAPIPSKRPGFLELNGTLTAKFTNGSVCEITCYPTGNAPVVVEIFADTHRYIVRESEGMLWSSTANSSWTWSEEPAAIPYQSQMTAGIVESLLTGAGCSLTPYTISAQIHLDLLDPLLEFVRTTSPKLQSYPFT